MELQLLGAILFVSVICLFLIVTKKQPQNDNNALLDLIRQEMNNQINVVKQDVSNNIQMLGNSNLQAISQLNQMLQESQRSAIDSQELQINNLQNQFIDFRNNINNQMNEFRNNILVNINQLEKSITEKQDILREGIITENKQLRESVTSQSTQLQYGLNQQMEQFRGSTTGQIEKLEQNNAIQQKELRESVTNQSTQLQNGLNQQMEQFRISTTAQIEKLEQTNSEQQNQFRNSVNNQNEQMQKSMNDQMSLFRNSTTAQIEKLEQTNSEQQKNLRESVNSQMEQFTTNMANQMKIIENRMDKLEKTNEAKLDNMTRSISENMRNMREENNKQLDQIRGTVDEKLQTTLEKRIAESFKTVSGQLEQVYKGLGEMQNLANDVGGLKKVLSGVKTRGNLGEYQLGAILTEILAPEQYETNVATIPNSSERVEFAVKLPHEDGTVWLPIDSKFPAETYSQLKDAQENGDKKAVELAYKNLETVLKAEAKDIRNKYVSVPYTTNFGILFLPAEGLYAEVVGRGMVEILQREYQINIAGPSTMAALLNSLQMGFKTLAIQKKSNMAWKVLNEVKAEFETFGDKLKSMQKHLNQTSNDLEALINTRTNQMNRKLRSVEQLDNLDEVKIIELDNKTTD